MKAGSPSGGKARTVPPLPVMATNFAKAVGDEVRARASGVPPVSEEEIEGRLSLCRACDKFIASIKVCSLCGCLTRFKARLRSQSCPEGKW